ncbi:MAG: metK [Candidatus Brocadiaceae bacterium]|nr:metK [Candidatus Brocadiaceae bacterium]
MKEDFIFTSESVTEGHPDKLCDLISDAIVDHFLQQNPLSMIIAECAVSTSIIFIAARFVSNVIADFPHIARQVINQVGYEQHSFNGKTCGIVTSLKEMSQDEYRCFDERMLSDEEIEKIPVRNQVTAFGFACQKILPYLEPDGKTQVGIEYRDRKPFRIHSITVIASQKRAEEPALQKLESDIREAVIESVFRDEPIKPDDRTRIFVNPEGPSGAALSGKDPTRIDRVGAYAARYAAKNVVAAGLAEECEVQLSYSIGLSRPVSIQVETFGTGKLSDDDIARLVERHFDFRLASIIKQFNLRYLPSLVRGGFYKKLAAYGHVGRMDIGLPWELIDKVNLLKSI